MNYHDQIQRIKSKLNSARAADCGSNAFGAGSHNYRLGPTASEREICAFEQKYSLTLPSCYRSFLTCVGNGGAGPFYGIYSLGSSIDEIVDRPEFYLHEPAIITPDISEENWSALDKMNLDENYEENRGRKYAGLLPLGSQGCSYIHALVLNGPYVGRVVNLELDGQKPLFAFERNFLDWYERWLDEIISGDLIAGGPHWFGYTMGGNDSQLMRVYTDANTRKTKLDALNGLTKLRNASNETCRKLLELCDESDPEIRHIALKMLAKFAYTMAWEPLRKHIVGDDDDCLVACQSVYWYAKAHSKDWIDLLRTRLPKVNAPETFRFMTYLFDESKEDCGEDLKSFCSHENTDIRVTAFYSLGKLKNKANWIDLFIMGLDDTSPRVVHTVLQALEGLHDQKLHAAYARVANRFKTDEHYILTNLEHRLKEMKLGPIEKFLRSLIKW